MQIEHVMNQQQMVLDQILEAGHEGLMTMGTTLPEGKMAPQRPHNTTTPLPHDPTTPLPHNPLLQTDTVSVPASPQGARAMEYKGDLQSVHFEDMLDWLIGL